MGWYPCPFRYNQVMIILENVIQPGSACNMKGPFSPFLSAKRPLKLSTCLTRQRKCTCDWTKCPFGIGNIFSLGFDALVSIYSNIYVYDVWMVYRTHSK